MTPEPQPIDADAILNWYDRHARTLPWRVPPADRAKGQAPDPYRIWLSEVMLQQTTIGAVIAYYERFLTLWPDVFALAAAPLDAVLVEWAGLGYYARARNLHACAREVVARHGGRFPQSEAGLRTLPGIGAYTSAAIAAICFDERVPVLDGNVERVLARYLALQTPVRENKPRLHAELAPVVPKRAGDFAQAMMDLGATICAPRTALCMLCPIAPGCAGRATGHPERFPVKPAKPERPVRHGHAFVMRDSSGDFYLRRRADKGLLGGMSEVPTGNWTAEPEAPRFPVSAEWRDCGTVVHVFTHFRLELKVWAVCDVASETLAEGWWSAPDADEALPTVFSKALAAAGIERKKKNRR